MLQNWKKNFSVFMISQAISLLGSSLVQYAITWHVTLTTSSGVAMTVMILCGILPTFFLAPFAGVWADRYSRKTLVMVSDGCIAACTLILAVVFLSGYQELWLLYVASIIRALGAAVQTPCISAMLPDLVPEEHLSRANGINSTVNSAITLSAPMLGAALLSLSDLAPIFFIDVITAAVAILVVLFYLKVPKKEKAPKASGSQYFRELREGIQYILRHKYLWILFVFMAIFFFSAAPSAFLTPLQVTRNYGGDVWRLSAIEIVFSVGMLLGGLFMSAWAGLKNRVATMALGTAVMASCTLLLGVPLSFVPYLALMTLFGIAIPVFNTPAMVILQERVDPDYMGRVFGVMTMVNSCFLPLGMLAFGPLADWIAIELLLFGTGFVILISSLLLLFCRPLMLAGRKKEAESAETE